MISFLFFVASSIVAAPAPISPASCFKDAGPRELAIETVCPSLTNFDARQIPISPEPIIPIFITQYFNNAGFHLCGDLFLGIRLAFACSDQVTQTIFDI